MLALLSLLSFGRLKVVRVFRPTQVFSSTWRRTAALSIMLSLLALATLPVNGGGGISAGQLSMGCPAQKAGVGKNFALF